MKGEMINRNTPRWTAGFTLVEMLIVMMIILMLLGLMLPAIKNAAETGKRQAAMTETRLIANGLKEYLIRYGWFPLQGRGDTADRDYSGNDYTRLCRMLAGDGAADSLFTNAIMLVEFPGSRIDSGGDFLDPWGNPYRVAADWDFNGNITGVGDLDDAKNSIFLNNTESALGQTYYNVAVWSPGPDGIDSDGWHGVNKDGVQADDILFASDAFSTEKGLRYRIKRTITGPLTRYTLEIFPGVLGPTTDTNMIQTFVTEFYAD